MHLWSARFALICLVLIHLHCNPVDAGERPSMLDNQLSFDFESSREVPSAQCALGLPASTRGDSFCPSSITNLEGNIYGRWKIVKYAGKSDLNKHQWVCRCECGKTAIFSSQHINHIKSGRSKSCGCLRKEQLSIRRMALSPNYIGKRFGRLLVKERVMSAGSDGTKKTRWMCLCDCGNQIIVPTGSLRSKLTQSCGCLKREINSERYGVNGPGWNPELTQEERDRYRLGTPTNKAISAISKEIRKRDGYLCAICNAHHCMLHVHHIEPWAQYKDMRYEKSNLITLCKECHVEFHNLYGTDGDYYDFIEYISEIQSA